MSWLADRTGIHLGNVGAPVGALLGSFVGMPQLGAGLGQAVGAMGSGSSLGSAAAQGAGAYGGAQLLGGLLGGGGGSGGLGSLLGGGGASGGVGGIADASHALGDQGGGGMLSGILGRLGLSGKDAIGLLGGVAGGVMDQRNQSANRDQSADQFNRAFGLQERQYSDQHSRQQATSAGLSPVIQRLLGQWGGGDLGSLVGGPHAAPQAPQAAMQREPAPVPMRPQAPHPTPQQDPRAGIMGRLGYARPQMQMMPRAA